jgi:hypothetical protein
MQNEIASQPGQFFTEQPLKAVGTALGIGLVLSLLPVGRIVGLLVDVGFSLARPIILSAGIYKLSECCRPRPAAAKPE